MARRGASRGPKPPQNQAAAGAWTRHELRLPVWQFVRLMVQVKESLARVPDPGAAALSRAWSEVWTEVDSELTKLGKEDSRAFAYLMMDQEVVLEPVSPDQARTAARVLAAVVRTMRADLKSASDEGQRAEDLRFEIAELEETLNGLPQV